MNEKHISLLFSKDQLEQANNITAWLSNDKAVLLSDSACVRLFKPTH